MKNTSDQKKVKKEILLAPAPKLQDCPFPKM